MPIFPEVERNGYRAAKTYVPVQQMTGMTREEEELFEPGAGNVPKTADLSNADAIQHQQEPDASSNGIFHAGRILICICFA